MFVYKLVCETGKVYYGATKHSIKHRKSKGHHYCSCGDFINPTIEIVEKVNNIEELYKRELYYIKNFECVNKSGKGMSNITKENKKKSKIKYIEKIIKEKKFYCNLCDLSFQSLKKLNRHCEGNRHKLKYECFEKYGEKWKEHYLIDNKKRYNENKKLKNKLTKAHF